VPKANNIVSLEVDRCNLIGCYITQPHNLSQQQQNQYLKGKHLPYEQQLIYKLPSGTSTYHTQPHWTAIILQKNYDVREYR
jgi:hypothetical protein